ncbi:MAG TPA: DUF4931 domain-containing protein [Candidatus Acidoferrales bacterium]|nr:DUF4931 domain-containing protein [Candidatus Acidoferrales bacterium]
MPELRKDPVFDRWVIIATERANRPNQFDARSDLGQGAPCPFCSGNESMTPPEILARRPAGLAPNAPGWTLRVVPNKFPALVLSGELDRRVDTIYDSMEGVGAHEVIIETPRHESDVGALSDAELQDVIAAYQERIRALKRDFRLRSILIFKNQGAEAGATIDHAHSQIVAMPLAPPVIAAELRAGMRHYQNTGRCIYCDILAHELKVRARLVAATEKFLVACPFASRFPFETWIVPRRHAACFEDATSSEAAALAAAMKDTLGRMRRALGAPAFNYVIHSMPAGEAEPRSYHWHIEIMPKLTQAGGFEWGSGCFINPVAPEAAASTLRGQKDR